MSLKHRWDIVTLAFDLALGWGQKQADLYEFIGHPSGLQSGSLVPRVTCKEKAASPKPRI